MLNVRLKGYVLKYNSGSQSLKGDQTNRLSPLRYTLQCGNEYPTSIVLKRRKLTSFIQNVLGTRLFSCCA